MKGTYTIGIGKLVSISISFFSRIMRYAYEGLGILMLGGRGDRLRFLSDIVVFDIP